MHLYATIHSVRADYYSLDVPSLWGSWFTRSPVQWALVTRGHALSYEVTDPTT